MRRATRARAPPGGVGACVLAKLAEAGGSRAGRGSEGRLRPLRWGLLSCLKLGCSGHKQGRFGLGDPFSIPYLSATKSCPFCRLFRARLPVTVTMMSYPVLPYHSRALCGSSP